MVGAEPLKEKYYQTNAMYEYIEKNKLPGYTLAKENIWLMVYGDPESIPRLLLVISAVPEERYENMDITPRERGVMELAARFAGKTGLEYRVVRYCRDWPLDKVQYMEYPFRHTVIGINALKQLFERNGVRRSAPGRRRNFQRAERPGGKRLSYLAEGESWKYNGQRHRSDRMEG